ncbi:hypothetical protein [uncultured Rhodospira sp.]|uniref:hypothetical protein n=1 Tax=uncultured Rhodospira sp. TaxID=1936189 RepID=UPI002609C4B4|nr:hypothetical protein [uncultured Rhodospira sp.]
MTAASRPRRARPAHIIVDARRPAAGVPVRLLVGGTLVPVPPRRRPNALQRLFKRLLRRR